MVLTRIDPPFGDIAWVGNGPDSKPLQVGVEYKQIEDVLACIDDGRFGGHQAIGMVKHFDRRYLLVEGRIRTDRNTGILQKQKGDRWQDISKGGKGIMYRDLEHWYGTMEEQGQFRVKDTYDPYESARWVVAKHSWWTAKEWDDHTGLKQFYVPPPPTVGLERPSLIRRIAKELYKIGWEKSLAVETRFKSVREMVNANEQTWKEVDGIGKELARRIVAELKGTE